MRLIASIILTLFIAFVAIAQDTPLDKPVTLKLEGVSLRAVLESIEGQVDVSFAFNSRQVPVEEQVSIEVKGRSLKETHDQLLEPMGIEYREIQGQILLFRPRRKEQNSPRKEEEGYGSINKKLPEYLFEGRVRERESDQPLTGVNIFIEELDKVFVTDEDGAFQLELKKGSYRLTYSFVGYNPVELRLQVNDHTEMEIYLDYSRGELSEVIVIDEDSRSAVANMQMSRLNVPVEEIRSMPAFLGENDVLRVLQLLPGVQGGKEGQSGLFVRGGRSDQNLILLDGVPVYRPQHLLGIFSAFDGALLEDVNLLKGGFPARYGGRLSSVLDIQMREGRRDKLGGSFGIGLMAAKASIEGPLFNQQASFILSGRRSFWDLLAQPFIELSSQGDLGLGYHFKDINGKLDWKIGEKDRFSLTLYQSDDFFRLRENINAELVKVRLSWGNTAGVLNWVHLFDNQLIGKVTAGVTRYAFDFDLEDSRYNFAYRSLTEELTGKAELSWQVNNKHLLRAGLQAAYRRFLPNRIQEKKPDTDSLEVSILSLHSMEGAFFTEHLFKPSSRLDIQTGMRLGTYRSGNKFFFQWEPRVSAAWRPGMGWALKAAWSRMIQNNHLLGSSALDLPIDFWLPANEALPPQQSDQWSVGVARSLGRNKSWELSLEAYYKTFRGTPRVTNDYWGFLNDVGNLLSFASIQRQLVNIGSGDSKGLELLVRKKGERFSGWLGYTLSWTRLQYDNINDGKPFWADFDRRHELSCALIFQASRKIRLSTSWIYSSGIPFSAPVSAYTRSEDTGGYLTYVYKERNTFRTRSYHRLDLSIEFIKQKPKTERRWSLGVYNAYMRANPMFHIYDPFYGGNNQRKVYQISVFPVIPSVSYSLRFK
jgi:hypothetical protein